MDDSTSRNQEQLQTTLADARARLDVLVRELRAVDDELERLGAERKQHRLLHLACGALEELNELGGARLFFGDAGGATEHLRVVRSRVDAFDKRLGEILAGREGIVEELERQQVDTELLEDELEELRRQEEQRKLEWVIEREMTIPARAAIMPWSRAGEDDQRFRRSLGAALLVSLLLMLVVPRIPLPMLELAEEPIEVPERLTRLIVESRVLPPAPREEARPVPHELAEQKPDEASPQPSKPRDEGPGKGSSEGPGQGPGKGILAFREKLSGFRSTQNVARLGSEARVSNTPGAASGPVERAMVTTQAPGSSGGINLSALSRGVGGAGGGGGGRIAGVQVARATSTIAGGGGGRPGDTGSRNGPQLGRTDEEIQIVFDRHKAALYRLYNRELRNDPTLEGQLVLRLRIEPNGSVSLCELQSTDMRAPQLAAQVVDRVRTFDFGAKAVPAVTILYPIDFLPAS